MIWDSCSFFWLKLRYSFEVVWIDCEITPSTVWCISEAVQSDHKSWVEILMLFGRAFLEVHTRKLLKHMKACSVCFSFGMLLWVSSKHPNANWFVLPRAIPNLPFVAASFCDLAGRVLSLEKGRNHLRQQKTQKHAQVFHRYFYNLPKLQHQKIGWSLSMTVINKKKFGYFVVIQQFFPSLMLRKLDYSRQWSEYHLIRPWYGTISVWSCMIPFL